MPPTKGVKGKGWARFGMQMPREEKAPKEEESNAATSIIKKLHAAALTKTLGGEEQQPVQEAAPAEPEKGMAGTPHLQVAWGAVVRSASAAKFAEIGATELAGKPLDLEAHGKLITSWANLQASKPPEWFQELTEDSYEAFKDIFNLFDTDQGGYIDVGELYEGLKKVDSQVTREEVEATLQLADRDKSGGITFDEFLYMMSHADKQDPGSFLAGDSDSDPKLASLTKRVCLFYSAITRFTKEKSQPTYHLPHVIKHYTAGARLEGLTSRQLNQNLEMLTNSIEEKYKDSPYSKPLNMPEDPFKGKKKQKDQTSEVPKRKVAWAEKEAIVVPDGRIPPETGDHQKSKGNKKDGNKTGPDITKIPEFRLDCPRRGDTSEEDILINIQTPERHGVFPSQDRLAEQRSPSPNRLSKKGKKGFCVRRSWRAHKTGEERVKPPKLCVKYKLCNPTMDDLPGIKRKVNQVLDNYYDRVRQASVETSQKQFDKLCREGVVTSKNHDTFKNIYNIYSTLDPKKVVIASQWLPSRSTRKVSSPKLAPFSFVV